MRTICEFHNRINTKIITVMLILFLVTALAVSILNQNILRSIYEESFTTRVLLSNHLIAALIDSENVKSYVELLRNQDEWFKKRQVMFYNDREDLFRLQEKNGPEADQLFLLNRMKTFHRLMRALKSDLYWSVVKSLRELKGLSHSKYVYVIADTGVRTDDGKVLYTYIFDADDDDVHDKVDSDGLGTVNDGEAIITEIYDTKKAMQEVMHYKGAYGELYFAYAPVLDNEGNVVAILGTDVDLGEMYQAISKSMILFNTVFLSFGIIIILAIYIFVNRYVTRPLGELTGTAQKLADGDVYTFVPDTALRQHSELGTLAHAVNDMSGVYQNMIKSTEDLFAATKNGRLEVRNDASNYKGDIKKFIQQINQTLDAMTMYLNGVPEGIFIMSKKFEMYFRNKQFINYFGGMSAAELIGKMFPSEIKNGSKAQQEQYLNFLKRADTNTTIWADKHCYSVTFKEITLDDMAENSVLVIAIDITDLMREKENAQAAAKAKSDFLSRMSHEMRTPMNAIIGMAKIAENTDDMPKLKHCLSTIGTSSKLLLGIINDVLDMSKIEAGKLDLENVQINIEEILIKICNIVIENMERKNLKFNVILDMDLSRNYIGDELRLSQVITNLLSNAIKFTPEEGKITLSVRETQRHGEYSTLRFSVLDTGIGMSKEQIGRLFHSFEQADGSITRRFGGTGLGLAISKNIIEKMGGNIWVESEQGLYSKFFFEVNLERAAQEYTALRNTTDINAINAADIKLLVAEHNKETQERFLAILDRLGFTADIASGAEEAISLVETAFNANSAYKIIFLAFNMPDMNGFDIVKKLGDKIDRNSIIAITSFNEWNRIEEAAKQINLTRYITKPLFPSLVLKAINDRTETEPEKPETKIDSPREIPDFSGISIILAEDVEINREIFIALMADTGISIDTAEDGLTALLKFKENPYKYNLIIMDVQMPEMDGLEATKTIRSLDIPRAKTIPIIALTANAFKEDIDRCIECGMNDHLSKPIDEKAVIEKIIKYAKI